MGALSSFPPPSPASLPPTASAWRRRPQGACSGAPSRPAQTSDGVGAIRSGRQPSSIAGLQPRAFHGAQMAAFRASARGVLTATQRVNDECEDAESGQRHSELLETRKSAAEPLQSTRQPLDFVAPLVHFTVMHPGFDPHSQWRRRWLMPQRQCQLPGLVAFVRRVHDERGTPCRFGSLRASRASWACPGESGTAKTVRASAATI